MASFSPVIEMKIKKFHLQLKDLELQVNPGFLSNVLIYLQISL